MPDRPFSTPIKDILEELLGEFDTRTRETLTEYLDLQRVIVEDYGKFVDDELARDNEILKHFARLLVEQSAIAIKTSRTHRTHVREMHSRIVDAQLKFIDHLKEQVGNAPPKPPPPSQPGKPRRKEG